MNYSLLSTDTIYLFIGSLLTLALGAVGWIINSRNEHKKWLREKRYEAYIGIMKYLSDLHDSIQFDKDFEFDRDLLKSVNEVSGPTNLLSSKKVNEGLLVFMAHVRKLVEAHDRGDKTEAKKTSKDLFKIHSITLELMKKEIQR